MVGLTLLALPTRLRVTITLSFLQIEDQAT